MLFYFILKVRCGHLPGCTVDNVESLPPGALTKLSTPGHICFSAHWNRKLTSSTVQVGKPVLSVFALVPGRIPKAHHVIVNFTTKSGVLGYLAAPYDYVWWQEGDVLT